MTKRMNNYVKLAAAFIVAFGVMNCSRIQEKVEQKVNEKIDQKIDETMKKFDSTLSKEQIDSLRRNLDSLATDTEKKSKKHK